MSLRVLAVRTHYPHVGAHSGIGQLLRYLQDPALELIQHEVSDSDEDFPLRNKVIRALIRFGVRRGMAWYRLSDLWAEMRALRASVGRKLDVVHYLDAEHTAHYGPWVLSSLSRLSVRTVANFHQPPEGLEKLVRKDVVARLDRIVLISPDQRPYFDELVPPDRISLIPHGIDVEFFRPRSAREVKPDRYGLECLCVGHHLRDFDALGATARTLAGESGVRFRVVAARPPGLERLTNVRVETGLSDTELRSAYQSADVLFLPLRAATANNALLEGIACGLPVVSTDLPSVRFYVPGDEAVLVRGNDPSTFAEALLGLRDDETRRRSMSAAARRRAEELSWHELAPRYLQLYSSLAGA
jgi:glycosyltransferase involved in cell wall biosynthesis